MAANPLDGFTVDRNQIRLIGQDLQRPECILAERDGTLWSADARGGVVHIAPDGRQQIIVQQPSEHFEDASSEATRYLRGTLPNGLAFDRNGDFLISNFGTDCLERMTRDGRSVVLADRIDGEAIGKVNFVLRDSKDRIWITVSTRVRNWMHALRTDLAPGGAAALLVFFALAMQCVATIAVVRRETGGWRLPALQFTYMLALAYGGAWLTNVTVTAVLQ